MMSLFWRRRAKNSADTEDSEKLCDNLDFAAKEAYKLLRTNLMFTLPDSEKKCRVIGVTSSIRGEGKSTTAINLSYVLAATGKKILLIDGDLRLPTIAKKLKITADKGLSDVLLDPSTLGKAICVADKYENWNLILSGSIPPNPTEMLGSSQMARLIKRLAEEYDFIVIDLPPVNIVSDALVASPLLDGMLVVVRENFSTRRELSKCEKQLELSGVKMLGFVMSGVSGGHSSYKYKYKYHYKYGHSYYKYGYEHGKGERK